MAIYGAQRYTMLYLLLRCVYDSEINGFEKWNRGNIYIGIKTMTYVSHVSHKKDSKETQTSGFRSCTGE